jgi:hypothetical protein
MKLVYSASSKEVMIGDTVTLRDGEVVTVRYITEPHKPSSTGRVGLVEISTEYFPNVIGAEWIEREDQGWKM